jgi:hypothetical protein
MEGCVAEALLAATEINVRKDEGTHPECRMQERDAMNGETGSEPTPSEQKMRLALEARRGTAFTDEEWDEAKRNLLGLFVAFSLGGMPTEDEESN